MHVFNAARDLLYPQSGGSPAFVYQGRSACICLQW